MPPLLENADFASRHEYFRAKICIRGPNIFSEDGVPVFPQATHWRRERSLKVLPEGQAVALLVANLDRHHFGSRMEKHLLCGVCQPAGKQQTCCSSLGIPDFPVFSTHVLSRQSFGGRPE